MKLKWLFYLFSFVLLFSNVIFSLYSAILQETLIKTPHGLVKVELLKNGDCVVAGNGRSLTTVRIRRIQSHFSSILYKITTNNGTVFVSGNQKLYDFRYRRWIEARNITAGSIFLNVNGEHIYCTTVQRLELPSKQFFYELSLDFPHTFFISDAQVLVHNVPFALGFVFAFSGWKFALESIAVGIFGGLVGLGYSFAKKKPEVKFFDKKLESDLQKRSGGGGSGPPEKMYNMYELFRKTAFGAAIEDCVEKTKMVVNGQSVWRLVKDVVQFRLSKGDQLYLDSLHWDHLEVFDKRGVLKYVLDFAGNVLTDKLRSAQGRILR